MTRTRFGNRLVPALLVRDMREPLEFYRRLGFQVTGCHPSEDNASWAEVQRDSVTFQFHTEPPAATPTAPVCSGTFYLFPESVVDLAEELRGTVEFAWGPEVMEQDPNGYDLAFTEPA